MTFAKPGRHGAKFKGPFEKMMKSLSIPKPVKEELGITEEAELDRLQTRILNDEPVADHFILQNKPAVDGQGEDAKLAEDDG